jgi:Mannosyltransferase (PIG-V)
VRLRPVFATGKIWLHHEQRVESVVVSVFPLVRATVAWVAGNHVVSALIVSGTALLIGTVLFRRLVSIDFTPGVALRSAWFFLIFPTAYFLHVPYTESLFFVLIIGSLLAERRDCWWLVGMLGALSWTTRANPIILLPTLAVEAASSGPHGAGSGLR